MDLYYCFTNTSSSSKEISSYLVNKNIKFKEVVQTQTLQAKDIKRIPASSTIIVSDVTMLGSKLEDIIKTIKLLYKTHINLEIIKDNIIITPTLSFEETLDLSLSLRKSLFSIKNKSIQENLKNKGLPQGRPTGTHNKTTKLDGKKEIIINYLKQQIPKSEIAKKLNVGRTTLFMYLRQLEL